LKKAADVMPYVGGLYSLEYPEREDISPEFWKSRLHEASRAIFSELAKKAPTVFFLEDLHWADPSFVELLRQALLQARQPAIVVCAYRPGFNLFTSHQVNSLGENFREIRLQDLSLSDAQDMLESLLETKNIPADLKRLVQSKAEGNPFYLEELINSLIESEMLVRDNGHWKITRPIAETDISSSIHGLISGRLDRLETGAKRILQEASVIGRAFLYDILQRVTELQDRLEGGLRNLERQDLIRTRSFQPDLEYIFKHPLTQEVVYNGLLKKERQEIHEQIARVMETVFRDRLSEFYETLAFHYARGQSVAKAVDFLVKSGEKSLARYAVEEAHQYFRKAYDILASKEEISGAEKIILIDILNSWGYAYYYLGEVKEFIDIFSSHQALAESLDDKARVGMFYAWFGIALFMAGKSKDSYEYLCKGLELGEKAGNQKVVGYACTWLTWTCAELGLFAEGIGYGERAQKIAESFPSDQYLFFKSLSGLCYINFFKGDANRIFEGAKRLIEYGERNANSRCKVFGHWMRGFGYVSLGDMKSSQKSCEKAMEVALDPAYPEFPKVTLGIAYFFGGQLQEAEKVFKSSLDFGEQHGMGQISSLGQCFLSPILIAKGHMKQGAELLEKARKTLIKNQRRVWYALSEHIIGEVNLQIATGPKPALSIMAKNVGFLVKSVPFATQKAEEHFNKAIELLKEIGANGFLGYPSLSLGLLYKSSKRTDQAKQSILEAINIFQECGAEANLKQANEVLDSLE
jgi:tetratricopeptide (TPR) repeat protein